jgi:hypothetical protein
VNFWQDVLSTTAVWKVRGLTILLRIGTVLRSGDGLFFEVPPLASDTLLTTLHPENVLQTVDHFEISCLGAPFSWLEKPRNRMGRDLNSILFSAWKKWIGWTSYDHPSYNPDLAPCDFWAFPTMKRELRCKKFRSDQRSTARFREVGTTKNRPSPHLHKGPTRSNKVSPRTLETALVNALLCY